MDPLPLVIASVLAGLLGFSAHRAGICTVKVVEEVLTTRRAFMLGSFLKMILWAVGISIALVWLWPDARVLSSGWAASNWALAGGFVFGIGAVLNQGCAFSTLTRLGNGNLGMLLSLLGFAFGAWIQIALLQRGHITAVAPAAPFVDLTGHLARVALALLLVWALWELWSLHRDRPQDMPWRQRVSAGHYRLSVAAALMGLANGALYAMAGPWAYTRTIGDEVRYVAGQAPVTGSADATGLPELHLWLLFAALVAGVFLAALQSRRFRLVWRPRWDWLGYLVGGVLMGFGAAMIPGGNDVLLLHAIPGMSPHGLPAFAAMLIGIALALGVLPLLGQKILKVDCSGDICRV